jgi:hypothetical protein
MDDPEEAFEFSWPSGNNRNRVSLPIYKTTLEVDFEKVRHFRGSVDFSRLHAFQTNTTDLMVNPKDDTKDSFSVSCSEKISKKYDAMSELRDTLGDVNLRDSAVYTNDNSDAKRLRDVDKISHLKDRLETNSDVKAMELVEWTTNPETSYRCILKFRQERSTDSSSLTQKKEANEQPVVVDELEDFHRVSFSPEVLVFSAVEDNHRDELENVITNYKINLNFCYNSKNLTPLHLAAQLGFTQCIHVLLKHGANVNCLNSDNRSPLYMAFCGQNFECAILLIESGADIQQFTAQKLKEFENAKKISQTCYRSFLAEV